MDEPDDFVSFLGQLVDGADLEGAAAGIAAKVVAAGSMDGLSQAQHAALVIGVKEWISQHFSGYNPGFVTYGERPPTPECTKARDEVPWCEVYAAGAMFDGRCSWCVQVRDKD